MTAAVWLEALTERKVWDADLDAPRFRAGFRVLCATRRTWPVPQDLLDALPAREQLALTKQIVPADPERAAAAIEEIRRTLTGKDAAAGVDA